MSEPINTLTDGLCQASMTSGMAVWMTYHRWEHLAFQLVQWTHMQRLLRESAHTLTFSKLMEIRKFVEYRYVSCYKMFIPYASQ